MSEVIDVFHERSQLVWREPFRLGVVNDETGVGHIIEHKIVDIVLQLGESRSVQVGNREYVTVRRRTT